jgi:cysteine-rich repeat protein
MAREAVDWRVMLPTALPSRLLRSIFCLSLAAASACSEPGTAETDASHGGSRHDGSVCSTPDCSADDASGPDGQVLSDASVPEASDATTADAGRHDADSDAAQPECQEGDVQNEACEDANQSRRRACVDGVWGAWGECEPIDQRCTPNQVDRRMCGLNQRGEQQRICEHGAFGSWSECVDPDVCTDLATDESTCGLNGRGHTERTCNAGAWSEWSSCADPDLCQNDHAEQRKCGFNQRGSETRSCQAGAWGAWSTCVDADECRDDAQDAQPCGVNGNGTRTRSCQQGKWREFGSCNDSDECSEHAHDERGCGLNQHGAQARDCIHGRWSDWSVCHDRDECSADQRESRSCGYNLRGQQARTCQGGQWGEFSPCMDPDQCKNDDRSSQICGRNRRGVATAICSDGVWGAPSACTDPDECSDDAEDTQTCGLNARGHAQRECRQGHWTAWSSCADVDVCVDLTTDQRACGFNARGSDSRSCEQGRWADWRGCTDPDQCHNHDVSVQQCGQNGRGTRSQTCSDGQWQSAECIDQDDCHDQDQQQATCGLNHGGVTSRLCQAGHWLPWAACSVQCGNGALEPGEECDDKNGSGGDGCSSDCRIEHVEWIYQIPGTPADTGWLDTVQSNGTFVSWLNDRPDDATKAPSPRVSAVDSKGKAAWVRDFGVTQPKTFTSTVMAAGPAGETILYGRFSGKSSMLGDALNTETIFLSVLDKTGWDVTEARLQHQPSGKQPYQMSVVATSNGDLSTFGRLAVPEYLRMYNSVVTSWAPMEFYWLRLHPYDLTPVMTASFSVSGDQPSLGAFAADDTRQVAVIRGGYDGGTYRFEDGSSIEQTSSLILGVDNTGKRTLSYAFPSKLLLGQANVILLPNGQTIVSALVFPEHDGETIVDATGEQQVQSDTIYSLWFSADGKLQLIRPGRALGVHDGKLLLRNRFVASVELEPARPWARTLRADGGKPGQYLAAYASDGELVDAAVLFTRDKDPAQPGRYELHDDWILVQVECSNLLHMGSSEGALIDLSGHGGAYCLARFDTKGALTWATAFGDSYDATLDQTAVQGSDLWIFRWGQGVGRLDQQGRVTLDLPVNSARRLIVSDQGVWVRASFGTFSSASIVPSDPLDRAIDVAKGSEVVIKLRP